MFNNLIESQSHRKEFKRRSSFFLATTAAYALLFFAAGIAGIHAYDARLESQSSDLALLGWMPREMTARELQRPQPPRRTTASNNTRTAPRTQLPTLYENPRDPWTAPSAVSIAPEPIPPALPGATIGRLQLVAGSTAAPSGSSNGSSAGTAPVVVHLDDAPRPVPPKSQTLTSQVLAARAISLPQPVYPPIARQIHIQGRVNVQILVDESGRVISAQAVSGHPTLTHAAVDAAYKARFTPTLLNGQPVKVQGLITYNFVMQ